MITIQFLHLQNKYATHAHRDTFPTRAAALAGVKAYAENAGYSNVKEVCDDEDDGMIRYTARTPGGRNGRNVALLWDDGSEDFSNVPTDFIVHGE